MALRLSAASATSPLHRALPPGEFDTPIIRPVAKYCGCATWSRLQDAPPGLCPGETLCVEDPRSPLQGLSFPVVRVLRVDGRWAAVVRLPTGDKRMVYVSRKGEEPPPLSVPDLQELWERRDRIRSLAARGVPPKQSPLQVGEP